VFNGAILNCLSIFFFPTPVRELKRGVMMKADKDFTPTPVNDGDELIFSTSNISGNISWEL